MGDFRVVMCQNEYFVICSCLISNLYEPTKLPPYFRTIPSPPPYYAPNEDPAMNMCDGAGQIDGEGEGVGDGERETAPASSPVKEENERGQGGKSGSQEVAQKQPTATESASGSEAGKSETQEEKGKGGQAGSNVLQPPTATWLRITVDVQHLEMEVFQGVTRESSLAMLLVSGCSGMGNEMK